MVKELFQQCRSKINTQKIICLILLCILSLFGFSQNNEQRAFSYICDFFLTQNKLYAYRDSFLNVKVSIDPVNNTKKISYPSKKHSHIKLLKKLSKEEQISILAGDLNGIFPFEDTIIIVDSLGFFDSNTKYLAAPFTFLIQRKDIQSINSYSICLKHVALRADTLIVNIGLKNQRKNINFYFSTTHFKLLKSKITSSYY